MKKLIFSIIVISIIWSCSSHVRFTSENFEDIKSYSKYVLKTTKELLDEIEAELNKKPNASEKELSIVEHSKSWIGTPYKFGGTSKSGVDCSGFVQSVYSSIGLKLPRTSRQQYSSAKRINKEERQIGDLIFFRKNSQINHVGLYLGSNKMIHASTSKGVIIQDLDNDYLKQTFAGYGRFSN